MIAFVQVDNFGLAVERAGNPGLEDRPVALLHSPRQPRLVEVSAAARAAGLQPGMDLAEAEARCPELGRLWARPTLYAAAAARLWDALAGISPDLEPFAAGAAFLDLTACQAYYRHDPGHIARLLQDALARAGMAGASVAVSGDKTSARMAAQRGPSGGTQVLAPAAAAAWLAPLPLSALCGEADAVTGFFLSHGVTCCGDMPRLPVALAAQRFGNHGRRLWLMAQGLDPEPVRSRPELPGGPLLGRLLPPGPCDADSLLAAYEALVTRLVQRLAREGWAPRELCIGLRAPEGWRRDRLLLDGAAPADLLLPCRRFLRRHWFGEEVRQVELLPVAGGATARQEDIFQAPGRRRRQNRTVAN